MTGKKLNVWEITNFCKRVEQIKKLIFTIFDFFTYFYHLQN